MVAVLRLCELGLPCCVCDTCCDTLAVCELDAACRTGVSAGTLQWPTAMWVQALTLLMLVFELARYTLTLAVANHCYCARCLCAPEACRA